jgi:plastocyanin
MRRATVGALKPILACVTALALLGATAGGAASAPAPKPAKVTVNDFFFGPNAVTIKQGGAVKWVWSSLNAYPHDVHLKQGPKGLKEKGKYSTKTTAIAGAHFQKQFPTAGTYKYICTIHPSEMKLTVTVKK